MDKLTARDSSAVVPTEKHIQKSVVNYAKGKGVICYQLSTPKGVPDRIFIYNGRCILIEFKKKGGILSKAQQLEHITIKNTNTSVYVVADADDGINIINRFINGGY